jgi:hypothetical protein
MDTRDHEHSHVSAGTYRWIDEVIDAAVEASARAGIGGARTEIIAKLLVEDLDDAALEEIVRDWLEDRRRGI